MARERVISEDEQPVPAEAGAVSEESLTLSLRPRTLPEYVGQTQVVESLGIAIAAAKTRGEPLEHILFHGRPGLGKTTLAHIIAREMGAEMVHTSGPALEKPLDIVGVLSNLSEGEVLFIDEIHRLPNTVEEYLYSAMEDFQVDFVTGKGAYARTLPFQLKRFTLIGATTRAGLLTAPLRDRFGMVYHLGLLLDRGADGGGETLLGDSGSWTLTGTAPEKLHAARAARPGWPTGCSEG